MKKYTASEFEKGNEVFHVTNPQIKMVVIGVNGSSDEVICRWMNKTGDLREEKFIAPELNKWSDKSNNITVIKQRPTGNWLY